jgi:hypothetical protein
METSIIERAQHYLETWVEKGWNDYGPYNEMVGPLHADISDAIEKRFEREGVENLDDALKGAWLVLESLVAALVMENAVFMRAVVMETAYHIATKIVARAGLKEMS